METAKIELSRHMNIDLQAGISGTKNFFILFKI